MQIDSSSIQYINHLIDSHLVNWSWKEILNLCGAAASIVAAIISTFQFLRIRKIKGRIISNLRNLTLFEMKNRIVVAQEEFRKAYGADGVIIKGIKISNVNDKIHAELDFCLNNLSPILDSTFRPYFASLQTEFNGLISGCVSDDLPTKVQSIRTLFQIAVSSLNDQITQRVKE